MNIKPTQIIEDLRASYWFVPSCMVLLAVALAFLMPWLDSWLSIDLSGPWAWIGQTGTDGARTVLGAIAGSIIGVAGTTFSITMVAVSFASSNFGPRLVSNFMRDRGNQVTLGTFISTFVYCLLVLRRVHGDAVESNDASYEAFVPHLSVLFALVLALASVGVLIYFIHHVPETIDVDRLVASIGRDLTRSVATPFPRPQELLPESDDESGDGSGDGSSDGSAHGSEDGEPLAAPGVDPPTWEARVRGRTLTRLSLHDTGYLQAIELKRLVALADEHDLLVRVRYRPGNFVIGSDSILDIASEAAPNDSLREELRGCFAVGRRRTGQQNEVFLAEQLVEVIGRALSPGVNDPFTAIACFDWIKGALVELAKREAWERAPLGPVELEPVGFERFVAVIFDQTRQYVCSDRNVALHVLSILVEIAVVATRAEHRAALMRRMDELLAAAREAMTGPAGADDVATCHAEGMRLLEDPDALAEARGDHGRIGGRG